MKKIKVAWGITGAGDRIEEIVNIMKEINEKYSQEADINVYISKAGERVLEYYNLKDELKNNFKNVKVEIDSNTPFFAGKVQLNKYDFIIIAPTTSNTTSKISLRIGDTLISNAAIMGQKVDVPLYILPTDYEEGIRITKLPNGEHLKLKIREEDVEPVEKLKKMDKTYLIKEPEELKYIFKEYFNK